MLPSDFPAVKLKILNFVRTNRGFGPDQISRHLSIPLNLVHQAVFELKKEGLLMNTSELRIGRRQS